MSLSIKTEYSWITTPTALRLIADQIEAQLANAKWGDTLGLVVDVDVCAGTKLTVVPDQSELLNKVAANNQDSL